MHRKSLLPALMALFVTLGAMLGGAAPASAESAALASVSWNIVAVDTTDDVGYYASLALSPVSGDPSVAYYDATHTDLRLAYPIASGGNCGPGNSWHCGTQPGFSDAQGQYPSAAFRNSGPVAVAYYDGTNSLNRYNGYLEPSDSNPTWGNPVDNLQDYTGMPSTQTGRYNSLKFDSAGVAHIASQQATPAPAALRYATYVGSGGTGCNTTTDWRWACTTIDSGTDNTGAFASLDLDWAGNPRIAYRGPGGVLKLARYLGNNGNCGGNKWQCDVIDAGANTGSYISLFVPKCYPAACNGLTTWIAYFDDGNDRLKVAHPVAPDTGNCGFGSQANDWQCVVIETVGDASAMGVSLATLNGQPLVAYYDNNDSAKGILKVAYPASGAGNCGPLNGLTPSWKCDVVDSGARGMLTHDVGRYASLAVGSTGLAAIAYYDVTAGDLLVAFQSLAQSAPYQVFVPIVVQ